MIQNQEACPLFLVFYMLASISYDFAGTNEIIEFHRSGKASKAEEPPSELVTTFPRYTSPCSILVKNLH